MTPRLAALLRDDHVRFAASRADDTIVEHGVVSDVFTPDDEGDCGRVTTVRVKADDDYTYTFVQREDGAGGLGDITVTQIGGGNPADHVHALGSVDAFEVTLTRPHSVDDCRDGTVVRWGQRERCVELVTDDHLWLDGYKLERDLADGWFADRARDFEIVNP